MSKKPKTKTEEAFTPEQLDKIESKGDKEVQLQRQKEGLFQRYNAKRDSKVLARQVKWKRRAGVALTILVLVLMLIWIIAGLWTHIGDLVISVDNGAVKKGIVISTDAEGKDSHVELGANMVREVTNITYDWLPATLDIEGDGQHNGRNYLAYTFYLRNQSLSDGNPTKEPIKVHSKMQAVRAARSADEAVRILIYRNGVPTMYAKPNMTDVKGNLPAQEGNDIIPLETYYHKVTPENYVAPSETVPEEDQTQNKEPVPTTGEAETIVQFMDDEVVFDLDEDNLNPGDVVKYTIVVWVEGNDPECIDEIRGGYVKLKWFFSLDDEEL